MFQFDCEANTWRMLEVDGDIPAPRAHHSASLFEGSMVIVGGYGGQPYPGGCERAYMPDMHMLKIETLKWEKIGASGPARLADHASTVVDDKMLLIFGGRNAQQYFNSVHLASVEEGEVCWFEHTPDCKHASHAHMLAHTRTLYAPHARMSRMHAWHGTHALHACGCAHTAGSMFQNTHFTR